MKIVSYAPKYREDFINMNLEWINEMFHVEEEDKKVLSHIDEEVKEGAVILFAVNDKDEAMSTVMMAPFKGRTYEIEKFATYKKYRHLGAGEAVLKAALDYARKREDIDDLILVSNTKCTGALHLYRKYGFKEIEVDKKVFNFERGNIAFELKLK